MVRGPSPSPATRTPRRLVLEEVPALVLVLGEALVPVLEEVQVQVLEEVQVQVLEVVQVQEQAVQQPQAAVCQGMGCFSESSSVIEAAARHDQLGTQDPVPWAGCTV